MLSLKFVRWLFGYVKFSLLGGSPERFYNYCARGGFCLWNIMGRKHGGACVNARSYKRLRLYARRAGCRMKVREKHGLPFILMHMGKHRGIAVGSLVFFLILYLLSGRVWCVHVFGNSKIPSEKIFSVLNNTGLYQGALKKNIVPEVVEQNAMLKLPDIGWISVNIHGSVADIYLEEKAVKPDIIDKSEPCNIKASAAGQIISTQVSAGTLSVKKGDAVVKGQLLVSSVVEDKFGGNTLKHASAQVMAETHRRFKTDINLKRRTEKPTGEYVVRRNLDVFGAHIPLSLRTKPKGDYRVAANRTDIRLFGSLLPVGIYKETWTRVHVNDIVLTKEQALKEAEKKLAEAEKNEFKNIKVTAVKAQGTISGEKFIYTAHLTCEENIAEESEIFVS